MAAADHQEAVVVMEERAARMKRRLAAAGVDEIGILLAGLRRAAHAENAVLAVEHDLAIRGQVIRDKRRHADAVIDVLPVAQILRTAPRHLPSRQRHHGCTTTRSTKMPGVAIASGSRLPSSAISLTCATVTFPAIAITGLKFRAALR